MENPLFGGSKRGFLGVRKGGFLRRGRGAADFCAKLGESLRETLQNLGQIEGQSWGRWDWVQSQW